MSKAWIGGALVIIIVAIGLAIRTSSNQAPVSEIASPFPKGAQTYQVSSNEPGPKVREVIVSELDPKPSTDQKIRVRIDDPVEVKTVSITMMRDEVVEEHPLALIEGTAKSGVWEGSWKLHGTANFTYAARIVAWSPAASSTVTITFR